MKMNFNFRPMFGGGAECDLMDVDGGMCDNEDSAHRAEDAKDMFTGREESFKSYVGGFNRKRN